VNRHTVWQRALVLAFWALAPASCGRIGYEPRAFDAGAGRDLAADRGTGATDAPVADTPAPVDTGTETGRSGDGPPNGGDGSPNGGDGPPNGGDGPPNDGPPADTGPGGCAARTLCTLQDGFDQPTLSSNLLAYSDGTCTTGISGGSFVVTLSGAANKFCGLSSVGTLMAAGTLTIDSSGFPTTVSNLIVYFQIQDASDYVEFQLVGASLRMNVSTSAGTTQKASLTYDPIAHRYWRFQADASTIAYQTSADGNTWTTRVTTQPPFTSTSVQMDIGAGFLSTGSTVTVTLPGVNAL